MLRKQRAGSTPHLLHLYACLLLAILCLPAAAGCSMRGSAPTISEQKPIATQTGHIMGPPVPSSNLHGPTNFLLVQPFNFSQVKGATTNNAGTVIPLDVQAIKAQVTGELQRLLFVVDSHNNVHVYSPETSPAQAQVISNKDGSTTIGYTQKVNSEAGTIDITFIGSLRNDQLAVNYQQQYTPSLLINANASGVEVAFTTHVKWVTASQIPAAPSQGAYQVKNNGEIALRWASAPNAVAYYVYRLISDHDQQFQFLATVQKTSYIDSSAEARQNLHATKGITYAIFSVGPTSVEDPGGLIIPITS